MPRPRARCEARRVGPVGDHQRDLGRIGRVLAPPRSAPPCWSRGRRSGWRRACAPCASAERSSAPAIADARLVAAAATTSPIVTTRLAVARATPRHRVAPCRPRRTAIMPIPQLKVRSISVLGDAAGLRQPRNTGSTGTCAEIDAGAERLRQHARDVVGKSAAGDVGERLDRAGLADRGEAATSHRCASASSSASPRLCAGLERRRRAPRRARTCSTTLRTSEKPLECTPDEARPSTTSPAAMSPRGSSAPRSAAPTAKPARS